MKWFYFILGLSLMLFLSPQPMQAALQNHQQQTLVKQQLEQRLALQGGKLQKSDKKATKAVLTKSYKAQGFPVWLAIFSAAIVTLIVIAAVVGATRRRKRRGRKAERRRDRRKPKPRPHRRPHRVVIIR